jgi:outer membrane lipoprotein carrier protein
MIKLLIFLCLNGYIFANEKTNDFELFFNSFSTLKADFKQYTYSESDVLLGQTSGGLIFKRPQNFIWQTKEPDKQTLFLSAQSMWLIDYDLEQAIEQNKQNLSQTPLYWLINRPNNLQNTPQYSYSKDGLDWYLTHQSNQLRFGFEDNQLRAIMLTNKLNQTLLLVFENLQTNLKFKKNTFKSNIPNGFDIIKNTHYNSDN